MDLSMRARLACFSIALSALYTSTAVACSCERRTDAYHFKRAEVVFYGVARATRPETGDIVTTDFYDPATTTLEVLGEVKGEGKKRYDIYHGRDGASCGFAFAVGWSYLVFAWHDDAGRLVTALCSGTRRYEDAPPDPPELPRAGCGRCEVERRSGAIPASWLSVLVLLVVARAVRRARTRST